MTPWSNDGGSGIVARLTATPARQLAAVLGVALAWCVGLVAARVAGSGSGMYLFLLWNLFLALVPLGASTLLDRAERRGAGWPARLGCAAVWLLFLPNAPYLLTDLVHLAARPPVPLWYDLMLLLSCAATGLLMGFVSLAQVHLYVQRRRSAAHGWAVAVAALLLSGYGIYLGRFLRWNSWDVLSDPVGLFGTVLGHLLDPVAHPRTVGVTLLYGVGLALAYAALRVTAVASARLLHPGQDGAPG